MSLFPSNLDKHCSFDLVWPNNDCECVCLCSPQAVQNKTTDCPKAKDDTALILEPVSDCDEAYDSGHELEPVTGIIKTSPAVNCDVSITSVPPNGRVEAPDSVLNQASLHTCGRKYSPPLVWIVMCSHSPFTAIPSKLTKALTILLICRGQWAREEEKDERNPTILLHIEKEVCLLLPCAWGRRRVKSVKLNLSDLVRPHF